MHGALCCMGGAWGGRSSMRRTALRAQLKRPGQGLGFFRLREGGGERDEGLH